MNMSSSTFIESRLLVRVCESKRRSSCACFSFRMRSLSVFISMMALKFSTSRSRFAILAFDSLSSSAYVHHDEHTGMHSNMY